jgi:ATP-dependent helicase/nuclease subunit B
MHYVLEKCAAEISETVGFKGATPQLCAALTDKYTDLYIAERLGGFEDKSPRVVFLFIRLRPSVKHVVTDMLRELSRSDFVPLRFELAFGAKGELPPIALAGGGEQLYLSGTVDRVDGCYRGGRLYLRVVDYKTGKKSFSLTDVWYGMGMQMLLYLFSLERGGNAIFDGEIVPAGVLYFPARDKLISSQGDLTDEELEAKKSKELRRSGLLLNDGAVLEAMEHGDEPEYIPVKYKNGEAVASESLADAAQLAALSKHIDRRLLELTHELKSGKISAEPCYRSESDNACGYCPYGQICRFDEESDRRRYIKKVPADEFWNRIGGGGYE